MLDNEKSVCLMKMNFFVFETAIETQSINNQTYSRMSKHSSYSGSDFSTERGEEWSIQVNYKVQRIIKY